MGKKINWALIIAILNLVIIVGLGITFGIIEKNQRDQIIDLTESQTEFDKVFRLYEKAEDILEEQKRWINTQKRDINELDCINESILIQNQKLFNNATFSLQGFNLSLTKNFLQQIDLTRCSIEAETEGQEEYMAAWLWILIIFVLVIIISIKIVIEKKKKWKKT